MTDSSAPLKKVLVIEDEQAFSKVYKENLEDKACEVLVANDLDEAERSVRENKPNMIILDLALPSGNGLELLEKWSNEGLTTKVPVIVATNSDDTGDVNRALTHGARDYFVKSDITVENMINLVHKYLNNQ